LNAPFRWRWNRASFSFPTIASPPTSDYAVSLPDFGFLEDQWLVDSAGKIHQLNGATSLAVDSSISRPTQMAPQLDDNQGNITFRLQNTPDQIYTVNGDYQQKPLLMTSLGSTFGPVSDEFALIFQWGFLAYISLLVDDARFPIYEGYYLARLLGAQDGLTDQERDIFLGNWMQQMSTVTRAQGKVQQGVAGRGK
jgi:hypothetical protein